MSDNFNIDTTQAQSYVAGGLNPQDPTQTVGDMIAANQQKQAEQSQLVQQAVERTKQAKLATSQKTSADAQGVNPELADYMPKQEALEFIAHEWKTTVDDPEVQKVASSLPDQVERHMIQTIIRKKDRFPSRPVGQPFQAKDGQSYPTDTSGTGAAKLQTGQWYQPMVDDEGAVSYIPSGEASAQLHADGKNDTQLHKDWIKCATDMDPTKASSRTGLGQAYATEVAALRGSNLLKQPTVTKENMSEISSDLTRIMTQGVPTDSGRDAMAYHNLIADILHHVQYLTGNPQDALPPQLRAYLDDSFRRLRAIALDTLQTKIQVYENAYGDAISAHQNEWDKIVEILHNPPTPNMNSYRSSPPPASEGPVKRLVHGLFGHNDAPAAPAAAAAPAPSGPVPDYTVEEEGK